MKSFYLILALFSLPFLGMVAVNTFTVPIPAEKDCLVVRGVVKSIYEAGDKDVVFQLKDQKNTFYINRGLESGLDLQTLKADLLNKEVLIKYPDHFSSGHISKIEAAGKIIYSELKQ
jgi:hypothetical protein